MEHSTAGMIYGEATERGDTIPLQINLLEREGGLPLLRIIMIAAVVIISIVVKLLEGTMMKMLPSAVLIVLLHLLQTKVKVISPIYWLIRTIKKQYVMAILITILSTTISTIIMTIVTIITT